jgi:hypothetical protein
MRRLGPRNSFANPVSAPLDGWARDWREHLASLVLWSWRKRLLLRPAIRSQARQTSADRAWLSIARFYKNCREKQLGKKGYPQFQYDNRSVEYKHAGWKLEPDGTHLTITDGRGIGTLSLIGANPKRKYARPLATFPLAQIKRVRLVKRADG